MRAETIGLECQLPRKKPKKDPPASARTVVLDDQDEEESSEEAAQAVADAKEEKDPRKIPRAWRLPIEEFETFIEKYPDKRQALFYIYRLYPAIDRTQGPDGASADSNIDKVKEFSSNWLKHQHGSGEYQVRFHDNAKPGRNKQVCESIFQLNDYTEFPPNVDVREIIDSPVNRSFINGILAKKQAYRDEKGNLVATDPNRRNPSSSDQSEIADKALQFAERIMNRPGSKIEEHAGLKAVDALTAANQTMMSEFMKVIAQTAKSPDGGANNSIIVSIIGLITSQQQQQQNLMLKMFEMNQNGNQNRGLSLNSIIDAIAKLADAGLLNRGGASGEPLPWYQALLDKVTPEVGSLLRVIIANQNRPPQQPASTPAPAAATPPAAPLPVAGNQPAPPPPPASSGIPAGAAGIPASSTETRKPDEVIPPDRPAAPRPPATPDQAEQAQTYELGMHMIDCIERGVTGFDFAVSINAFYNLTAYAKIAQLGKEGIRERLKTIPDLWAACQLIEPELDPWLDDFLKFGKDNVEDASELTLTART